MPRLIKRMLPPSRNPLLQVPDNVLSVVEYAGLSWALDKRGVGADQQFLMICVIGIAYETYLSTNYGNGQQKLGGDMDANLNARNN